ncbi:Hypothetical protein ORPV_158 [Orpheovirus IHUMI-LCC2]|uniref:Uncharacterized protein n=1 Tax=Orpheovirus IHUMI-LCC2 TaxID=2023057 RepID=A0A2I2L3E6_9VIRU|nr:Hypothetical protein ORPV_158 [Orpheovirus IHUMI-LCC2]SNW62062.1 Hypothetical protein ORPV_158 [Orpheovirus IHUMI-LCC2]
MSANKNKLSWNVFYNRITNNDLSSLEEYGKKLDKSKIQSLLLSEMTNNDTFIYMVQNGYVDQDILYRECSRLPNKHQLSIYLLNNFQIDDNNIKASLFYVDENTIRHIPGRLEFNDIVANLITRGDPNIMESYINELTEIQYPQDNGIICKLIEDNYNKKDSTLLSLLNNNNINISNIKDNILKEMIKRQSYRGVLLERMPEKVGPMIERLRNIMRKKYNDSNYELSGDYLYVL